jgi:polyisoprenoid-binding protein YceI
MKVNKKFKSNAMKNNMKKLVILIAFFAIGLHQLQAQSVYRLADSKNNALKLSGTSTLHNWDMNATVFSSKASFDFKSGSTTELTSLKSLTFLLEVSNLSSGEKGLDKNAYKALKTKQFKDIQYKLTSAIVTFEGDSKYLLKTHGNLTIAGVTKEIVMDVHCVINTDGTITCTGSDILKMTDYQVKPPTFMLGAMKAGDALTLDFTVVYKKQQNT